ncbi:hypothetical protein [Roseovarius ramblicola]|uniref:Uncharacterized protein n=1 Tax=Roseovarius ramblicola TaxID=2022336 RepID=A0ABV5I6T4_9RHOB
MRILFVICSFLVTSLISLSAVAESSTRDEAAKQEQKTATDDDSSRETDNKGEVINVGNFRDTPIPLEKRPGEAPLYPGPIYTPDNHKERAQ